MSVYTTLTLKEVQDFALPYGLKVIDLIPIQGGIQNTNYFIINHDQQHYVLTIFEDMDQHSAEEIIPVLRHLAQQDLPVAVPLEYANQAIHCLKEKPAQIAPRLIGSHPIPANIEQVEAIATAQATMHIALQHFPLQRQSCRNHHYWQQVANELKPNLNPADKALLSELFGLYDVFTAIYPDRPTGFIHADLFRDNTLFQGAKLQGILDFYELNHDELLFDIAITINDFCTDYPHMHLDKAKANAFLEAYHQLRPLTLDEKACVELYLAMAAGRFWLMRLQVAEKNKIEGRCGGDILQKDPFEMRNMLIERLKFVTA
ncbi:MULTISPECIES: homoserine kinase [unclassified Acinetobacter]|uniref:homoserine kinase n=1 Tax=unclassified Acinetobacter TaxID=196816 RepID=UPI002934EBDF|nr:MULTISPECIES: homoserine kinase [unclassified Acinetobacter]WOE31027.1 homoserine kinase [Acinetobacter sp. SAAs470]WOE39223.1 homoserine kinase [Acinetobacter sp. SAAs474]